MNSGLTRTEYLQISGVPKIDRMSKIELPNNDFAEASNVASYLQALERWRNDHPLDPNRQGFHSGMWARGHAKRTYSLEPGVYRESFTRRARTMYGMNLESKRLNLEREMLTEFRTAGAALVKPDQVVTLYLIAQHHGMPTRLLDWTTNPLAALFFAVRELEAENGEVVIMDPRQVIPGNLKASREFQTEDLLQNVRTMRHPLVCDVIGESFWHKSPTKRPRLIFPLRPDTISGRIGQQSSCFTLHAHDSQDVENQTLRRITISSESKCRIFDELRSLNVNEFTIFGDLDHLSAEIRKSWQS